MGPRGTRRLECDLQFALTKTVQAVLGVWGRRSSQVSGYGEGREWRLRGGESHWPEDPGAL